MVVLSDRVFFCVFFYATGAAQLVLSSIDAPADAAKSLKPLSDLNPAESRIASLPIESTKPKTLDQHTDNWGHHHEYGTIPQGEEERKDELRSMVIDRNQIERQIEGLKSKSFDGFSQMLLELQTLHRGLWTPTKDRVRKMGGLETSLDFLPPRLDAQLTTAQTDSSRSTKNHRINLPFIKHLRIFRSKDETRDDPVVSDALLYKSSLPASRTTVPSDTSHLLSSKPGELTEDGTKRMPTYLEFVLRQSKIPIGDLIMQSAEKESLWGHDPTDSEMIASLNSLQKRIQGFKSVDGVPKSTETDFQLKFLGAVLLMRHYILQHELLPSELIDSVEIFKAKSIAEMAELHVQLLFRRWGHQYFDAVGSVVPELDFLTSAPAVEQLHGSIKALPVGDQEQVVRTVMDTIISHAPDHYPPGRKASERFDKIREAFRQVDSLDQGRMNLAREANHQADFSIKYQLVYYMLDHLNTFYHPIKETVIQQREDHELVQDQLKFISVYLKHYRNKCLGNTSRADIFHTLREYLVKARSVKPQDAPFHRWVRTSFAEIFPSKDCLDPSVHTSLHFSQRISAWMTFYKQDFFIEEKKIADTV
ncbi:uncharacterized protein PGTG_12115 [Puccinia graminis f. sp. tritici CRL 75-36-700-3]|uniref:Uncharacterized protein n=1 Tax=Puccinia graminis f. sp. tritici (strain CRL 75-36-700-3 / race SCCL) TaxID=418459 RepID=E3KPD4_PUCGT|nr:uncharacterized protein PGTG_12115 [Puccinia graminis f. sp. tritici CRL 75-36-700-3]EFP86159.2 hypothetical protein PGTG_12115 [Puccinia graminis f. sp. tritici CRL 75-36-700-3]